jgi:DNA-binding transcriptional LysR family regulator
MIDKLEHLIALAREKHFGRAAEANGVSQPTLSAAIQSLEDQLGVRIVERGARFHGLTPEGQRVLEWARRIVGDARTLRDEMRAAHRGLAGHLRLAVIPTALAMVPALINPFRDRHPEVRFTVLSRNSLEILNLLENLEVDAGVTYLDNEPLGRVVTVPLYAEVHGLIVAKDHEFAARDRVSWAEVAALPLCLLTPDMQNRRIVNGLLATAGAEARPSLESNSMIALLAHVRSGGWASVMPISLVTALGLPEGIRAIPIREPDASQRIGLIAAHREPHTPLVAALLGQAAALSHRLR